MRALALLTFGLLAAATARAGDPPDGAARRNSRAVLPNLVRLEGPGGLTRRRLPFCGTILGDEGVVVTIMRLGSPGSRMVVKGPDGKPRRARVVARDPVSGVTALVLDSPVPGGLPVSRGDLSAGAPVLMAGYGFGVLRGFGHAAVSSGIVAQFRPAREGEEKEPARYLLSSAVNPGDAGGALVDGAGRFAGVLLPDRDPLTGLSTAIPVSTLRALFAGAPAAAKALAPGPAAGAEEWPVHARLAEVARKAWPAVLSLKVNGRLSGSAFLIDGKGHAVTGRLPGAGKLEAFFADGSEAAVKVLGVDEQLDVVVLRVKGENLPPPPLFSEVLPPVGAFVIAVGNPNGERADRGPLMTVGIVGARNRADRRFGALHTDAAVNRGNLGGPLLDLEGRVVGVLSSLAGESIRDIGVNSGVGYAIPMPTIMPRLKALIEGRTLTFRPGYLGISLDMDPVDGGGIRIATVRPGHSAQRGGILTGDVILEVDGAATLTFEAVRRAFSSLREGAEVVLVIRRGEERLEKKVRLDPWPKDVRR